jgi:hypothetical protein
MGYIKPLKQKIINSPKKRNGGGDNISRLAAFIKVGWNDRNWEKPETEFERHKLSVDEIPTSKPV